MNKIPFNPLDLKATINEECQTCHGSGYVPDTTGKKIEGIPRDKVTMHCPRCNEPSPMSVEGDNTSGRIKTC